MHCTEGLCTAHPQFSNHVHQHPGTTAKHFAPMLPDLQHLGSGGQGLPAGWDADLMTAPDSSWWAFPERCPGVGPLMPMGCDPRVSLVRITHMRHNKLFECSKDCPSCYAGLLLITVVSWVQLRTWHGALLFDSTPGKPTFPHNVHHHLEGYLCLCML